MSDPRHCCAICTNSITWYCLLFMILLVSGATVGMGWLAWFVLV